MLERVERKRNPLALWMKMQIDTTTMENSTEFLKKLKLKLPYDPAIPLLGIYSEKAIIQNYVLHIYIHMYPNVYCSNILQ